MPETRETRGHRGRPRETGPGPPLTLSFRRPAPGAVPP
ncbi:hypothetical protein PSMK_09810 [Phycisphaera mikurensis NBRC 102666]|uniref:Uncharacterized protein n=1 Tax=Phycisphaera mikurensis (strain NBRC 102666 / KCTC 22515 / FYK2301M01) TaxID=1142394 RepID=I0ID02_PHYMF|nr:hypothetical protein PSMK_09810 [Phycisphaera mikurensis NBRC 102666]